MRKFLAWVVFFAAIYYLGLMEMFAVLFLVVSLHEMAHVFAALLYGLRLEKIGLMPIGQFAVIKNLELLPGNKRALVVLAGPLCNIILGLFFYIFFEGKFELFMQYNFVIAFFNLLPSVPLDGGKLFQIYFGNKIGVLRANKLLIKISRVISIIIIILGVIQCILFKYNISLILVGAYIYNILERENFNMATVFYKVLLNKHNNYKKRIIPIEHILLPKDTKIKTILNKLCWDKYFVFNIMVDEKIHKLSEHDFSRYVFNVGIHGDMYDIINSYY
ncbi:MAG: site-2 protease family protein [Clostridiales bacterium]|jgi:stage IV sporulation protein FB|nr:site-2 protease family protein [Clostridiales bacterium]